MLPYKEYKEDIMNCDILIDLLQRAIDFLRSEELSDKDFIDFLISLINIQKIYLKYIMQINMMSKNLFQS